MSLQAGDITEYELISTNISTVTFQEQAKRTEALETDSGRNKMAVVNMFCSAPTVKYIYKKIKNNDNN